MYSYRGDNTKKKCFNKQGFSGHTVFFVFFCFVYSLSIFFSARGVETTPDSVHVPKIVELTPSQIQRTSIQENSREL